MSTSAAPRLAAPNRRHVAEAAERLRERVVLTPVVRPFRIEARSGLELWLKAENLQRVGAFKARGALNAVAQLSTKGRAAGLLTYSSGNHGQAVAWAGREFGAPVTVFMPEDAPAIKVEAIESMGAKIVRAGLTSLDRREAALAAAGASKATIVEPFDHPHTIAGQGTATLELAQQVRERAGEELDDLFVPVGGGGLIAGACLALEGSETRIHAVEPEGCDSLARSLAADKVVAVPPAGTLADGLRPTRVGELNYAICRERVSRCHRVGDVELCDTLRSLLVEEKLLVEPSGAAALSAALREGQPGRRIGVILSGGNVAPDLVARILGR